MTETRPVGRPTKYNDEILEKARDYIANFADYGDVIPQIAGLSMHLDIARETVYDWAKQEDKREFSDIVRRLLSEQERTLMNKGLGGEFNPNITKLALSKHGYAEKQDIHATGGFKVQIGDDDAEGL